MMSEGQKPPYGIIFFTGRLQALDYFTSKLIEGARHFGVEYYVVDVTRPETWQYDAFHTFCKRRYVAAFCFNQVGLGMLTQNVNLWEEMQIPVYTFVQDHPRNFSDALLHPIDRLHVIVLDRNHAAFIRRYYPEVKSIYYMPNGGWEEYTEDAPSYRDREIEVVFFGSFNVGGYGENEFFEDGGASFYNTCVNRLAAEPMRTTESVIEEYVRESGISCDNDQMRELIIRSATGIESTVRGYYKRLAMQTLGQAGIHVEIYGDNWLHDGYVYHENIKVNPRITPGECNRIVKKAKIALNFMPWFKDGCSERVFNNMLGGAVCVTEQSGYLKERFLDGKELVYYDPRNPEQLAADVRWLLDHEDTAAQIAARGYEAAKDHDTWIHRFEEIYRLIQQDDDRP
ncbi:MAG: glycosyltransferase [Lachnospiraceae bacterium]|nr:glycosyltransferase [Lachnospiraceae bacterium]